MSLPDMGVFTLASLVPKGANSTEDVLSTPLDRALSLSTLVEVADRLSYKERAARIAVPDAASVHQGGLLIRSMHYGAERRLRLERDGRALAAGYRHALDERRRAQGPRIARSFSHGDMGPPLIGRPAQTAVSKRRPLGSHLTHPLSTL